MKANGLACQKVGGVISTRNRVVGQGRVVEFKQLHVMRHRGQSQFDEEEYLAFAKSYLSEAFPNPKRIDCPPHSELMRTAEYPTRPGRLKLTHDWIVSWASADCVRQNAHVQLL